MITSCLWPVHDDRSWPHRTENEWFQSFNEFVNFFSRSQKEKRANALFSGIRFWSDHIVEVSRLLDFVILILMIFLAYWPADLRTKTRAWSLRALSCLCHSPKVLKDDTGRRRETTRPCCLLNSFILIWFGKILTRQQMHHLQRMYKTIMKWVVLLLSNDYFHVWTNLHRRDFRYESAEHDEADISWIYFK